MCEKRMTWNSMKIVGASEWWGPDKGEIRTAHPGGTKWQLVGSTEWSFRKVIQKRERPSWK